MATIRVIINTYKQNNVDIPKLTQSTRLTPPQIDERRENKLHFNCEQVQL
jgi:hypothetical protein